MKTFNPNKKIQVEIHLNCPSMTRGYTIWRIDRGIKKNTLSRNADGKDFDWMTDKQMEEFEAGKYKFTITAQQAIDYFQYLP